MSKRLYDRVDKAEWLRFEELLPFFMSGNINEEDNSFCRDFIKNNPDSIISFNFNRIISRALQEIPKNRDSELALKRFSKNLTKAVSGRGALFGLKMSPKYRMPVVLGAFMIFVFIMQRVVTVTDILASPSLTVVQLNGPSVYVAKADACFVLNSRVTFERFFNVADAYNARIVFTKKVAYGTEVHVDLDNESLANQMADELAAQGIVKPEWSYIAKGIDGPALLPIKSASTASAVAKGGKLGDLPVLLVHATQ